MPRPKEHDEQTADALLGAAERLIEAEGLGALSLRELARAAGTTTRAVYSLFGSKEGLVGALGGRAFDLLQSGLDALPATDDPQTDVVDAALMFRRFALEHPALFSIGIQLTEPSLWPRFSANAAKALTALHRRFEPLAEAGLLGSRSVPEAALQFRALCEGLAAWELRRTSVSDPEGLWRRAVVALVAGFAAR